MNARSDGKPAVRPFGTEPSAGHLEIMRVLGRSERATSVVDQILVSVGTAIVESRLHPGDDLNSVELARMFQSSRTPVREALLTLEREGLVEINAHRRPRVRRLSLDEVRDIYELRSTLYALVSRRIVENATESELGTLRDLQHRLEQAADAGDVDRYFWLNVDFRNYEASIAGNRTVRRVLDGVGVRTLQLRHLSLSLPGRLGASVADHERLLRAYEDRDADLASALTQTLVRRGLAAIETSGWTGRGDS
ncbi:GntR family transcriptional regulator [Actinophytocola gossypii]|uniref:GntR family transcriptional regulator n=1 Tax=Actinophytocola gossypii TaxID=2812003 RepID=A0ABT2JJ22_9PSEU|nr:GntR family transcriptional regulator [Actinophytocola gossypii]MCT2587877.1 GntR family transcriptional regulator [Actinophytocola gossypii]